MFQLLALPDKYIVVITIHDKHLLTDDLIIVYILLRYSGTPRLRPPPKSEWGGLKRGVVSREGFATFNTRGRLQRLTSTLGGAYNH